LKRAIILPALAVLGIVIAAAVIHYDNRPKTPDKGDQPDIAPFQPPFAAYVAGTGIVEAGSGNIAVGPPVSGIVIAIYVHIGDQVNVGDPLFKIDTRDLEAGLITAQARIQEAAAALQKPTHRLERAQQMRTRDPGLINDQDFRDLQDETAEARAALDFAKAQAMGIQMEISRRTVRALVPGEIISLKLRPGEFVEGRRTSPPLLLIGDGTKYRLRIDVDEHDAWRIRPGAQAVACARGRPKHHLPLHFEYIEPVMVPKTSLSGLSTERTDTRVLQILYRIDPGDFPVYIGQQLDAFIRTDSSPTTDKGP
jgi:HlyD family secretion protein